MKRLTLFAVIYLIALTLCAQAQYPVREIDGKSYYEYTVEKGDGLFSIARRFNISQAELHLANPQLSSDVIKVGETLLIPIHQKRENLSASDAKSFHIVEPKQTLFAISRLYNIPLDSIEALNPRFVISGLHPGDTVVLSRTREIAPKQTLKQEADNKTEAEAKTITHVVQPKETLYAISKKYNIGIHDILELNPGLEENGLKSGTTIFIHKNEIAEKPVLKEEIEKALPKDELKVEEKPVIESVKEEVATAPVREILPFEGMEFPTDRHLKIAYLLPLQAAQGGTSNSRFAEFYKGSLLALLDAKNKGINAEVFVYDTEKSNIKVDSILKLSEMQTVDVIIGPAYSDQVEPVVKFARARNIVCIVPFSNKIPESCYYSKLYQFNPPHKFIFNKVLTTVFEPRHMQYIFCNFYGQNTKTKQFALEFKSILDDNGVRYTNVNASSANLDSIFASVGTDSTVVILSSTQSVDVAPVVEKIKATGKRNIEVWGFEDWSTSLLHSHPATWYYSLFNANVSRSYSQTYQKYFGANSNNTHAQYDLIGWDITTWLLYSFSSRTDGTIVTAQPDPDLFMQTVPRFEYIGGRFVNTSYNVFFWNGYSEIKFK